MWIQFEYLKLFCSWCWCWHFSMGIIYKEDFFFEEIVWSKNSMDPKERKGKISNFNATYCIYSVFCLSSSLHFTCFNSVALSTHSLGFFLSLFVRLRFRAVLSFILENYPHAKVYVDGTVPKQISYSHIYCLWLSMSNLCVMWSTNNDMNKMKMKMNGCSVFFLLLFFWNVEKCFKRSQNRFDMHSKRKERLHKVQNTNTTHIVLWLLRSKDDIITMECEMWKRNNVASQSQSQSYIRSKNQWNVIF